MVFTIDDHTFQMDGLCNSCTPVLIVNKTSQKLPIYYIYHAEHMFVNHSILSHNKKNITQYQVLIYNQGCPK